MGIANWYDEHVVPRLIKCACSSPAIMYLREQVVPLASGAVLDYARAAAQRNGRAADIRQGLGEAIPYADASFDCVVCTFTLCSVDVPAQVLREMRRVLKPGGRLLYAEHGRAPDAGVAKWQDRIEPLWKRLAGGCHLTRPVAQSIALGPFAVTPLGASYAPKTPRWAGWMEWGEAVKTA
jgi:SAM-dependent methyltransferase